MLILTLSLEIKFAGVQNAEIKQLRQKLSLTAPTFTRTKNIFDSSTVLRRINLYFCFTVFSVIYRVSHVFYTMKCITF